MRKIVDGRTNGAIDATAYRFDEDEEPTIEMTGILRSFPSFPATFAGATQAAVALRDYADQVMTAVDALFDYAQELDERKRA